MMPSSFDPPATQTTFDFVAAVNDDEVLAANLARSRALSEPGSRLHILRGYRSASVAYNAGLDAGTHELVVFAHQDVYLPAGWAPAMSAALAHLDAIDPAWAVLGLFGSTAAGGTVGHVWSSGLQRLLGAPFDTPMPVASLDELLLVVRRSSGLRFDAGLHGYHLYGTDIVQSALSSGRSAYAVCAPVIHNSRPVLYLPREYLSAYVYMRRKWARRLPIPHGISPIVASRWRHWRRVLRARLEEVRFGHIAQARLARGLDCVSVARSLGFE